MSDTHPVLALVAEPAPTPQSTALDRLRLAIEGKGDLALYEGFKFLARLRMKNNVRANLLNASNVPPPEGTTWTSHKVVNTARELRVRLTPYPETLYMSYMSRRRGDEALLGLILEEMKEGKITTGAIRQGLQEKYGGTLALKKDAGEGELVVPSTSVIGRVIQMCANDSDDSGRAIKEAFEQGCEILSPTTARTPGYQWVINALTKKNERQHTAA